MAVFESPQELLGIREIAKGLSSTRLQLVVRLLFYELER
jgi:hypothetical protein